MCAITMLSAKLCQVSSADEASFTLLLVLAGRAVNAAGAVGCGAAPDALVATGAVAVLARGGVYAA